MDNYKLEQTQALMKAATAEAEQKGIEQGLEKTAISMLKEKLAENLIAQITGLSLDKIAIIKAKL